MPKTYRVTGMTCQGCVNAVTRAIQRRMPGARVSVDLARGTVTVDSDAGAPADDSIRSAVNDAGFNFAGAA
ncbi:MAG: heavy-metal-associated domain-containing protein [Alphaproteobacteria bacterium]|nr:heavy-metal-associated domain-containing protein [Alphaproteobacteria bacterium]